MLSEIVVRYDTKVLELVRLNDIKNPDLIYPGEVLRVYKYCRFLISNIIGSRAF